VTWVGNIVGLGKNFEVKENLDELARSKSSKFEISDIHGSPRVKNETCTHRFMKRVRV
jgi:hypothetical protein